MAQTSQLSRTRPMILTSIGIAAAFGAYIVYTSLTNQPNQSALKRSNAVNRHRQRLIVDYAAPDEASPLGRSRVRRGSRELTHNVADGALTLNDVRMIFEGVPDDPFLQRDLGVAAAESVLHACLLAQSPVSRERIVDFGLDGLPEAMAERNLDVIRDHATHIAAVLRVVSIETIEYAIRKYIESDAFAVLQSSDDGDTFAETEDIDGPDGSAHEPSQGLKGLLYHIAETDAKRKAYEHRGFHCEECGEHPIRGIRWHCLNCPDFDLCSTCESSTTHQKTHVFAKIKIPLPVLSQPTKETPIWYAGDPTKLFPILSAGTKRELQTFCPFDEPQIDAFYDQFTSIANVPWDADPDNIKAAIDRRAFNKALTSEQWTNRFRPNAIYDRMFAYYDTDSNGLIGFHEFLAGLWYLRGPRRFASLSRALRGYDIDGDGYVDRNDFMRLFRAKYEIQKLLIDGMVERHDANLTQSAMETLRSSQPISSTFSFAEIPQGENRPRGGKFTDSNGDLQPLPETRTILGDNEGRPQQGSSRWPTAEARMLPHRRLQEQLSRFDDLVDGAVDTHGRGSSLEAPIALNIPEVDKSDHMDNVRDVSTLTSTQSGIDDEGIDEDVLWHFVEDGFSEMLDPLFRNREKQDERVVQSRLERKTWQAQIQQAVEDKRQFQKDLQIEAELDPLLATAMSALTTPASSLSANVTTQDAFRAPMVPTDPVTLTRREAEIAQQPLEALLQVTGYSTLSTETHDRGTAASASTNGDGSESVHVISVQPDVEYDQAAETRKDNVTRPSDLAFPFEVSTSDVSWDCTLPQHRPNTVQRAPPLGNEQSKDQDQKDGSELRPDTMSPPLASPREAARPPSRTRLEYLASLNDQEKNMRGRGGPGRLSFEEVEAIVRADSTMTLKGLIVSWLEWASF